MTTHFVAQLRGVWGKLRWIHVAPILAVLTLSAWAFASPIGASPDDDYHLTSTWCALGGTAACTPVADPNLRKISTAFDSARCYAFVGARSASCQDRAGLALDGPTSVTDRGNFHHKYPPVYYGTMRLFAGDDLESSALAMRLFNVILFVGLGTALAAFITTSRRQTLLWGWLVSLVPLGMFIIPSNNPSGWSVTGVGTAFMALLGWFETSGKRRWALGALYGVGILMAAGSRGDAAIFASGATVAACLLTFSRTRDWVRRLSVPLGGLVVAGLLFLTTRQTEIGIHGIPGGDSGVFEGQPLRLAVHNLVTLPYLWTGVWGTWALGWFDTQLPAIVPWAAVGAFVAIAFVGLGLVAWRKALAIAEVFAVLVALPVYVLTVGGDAVGSQFQPRYILPLIVLFSLVLVTGPKGMPAVRLHRVQTIVILAALAIANVVALQANIRRYVTGADRPGFNLDAGAEWWWRGAPVGPMGVWIIGSVSFAVLLAVLWPELRRKVVAS